MKYPPHNTHRRWGDSSDRRAHGVLRRHILEHRTGSERKLASFLLSICRYRSVGSRLAPTQWETSLQCNTVSHWLSRNQESALYLFFHWLRFATCVSPSAWYGSVSSQHSVHCEFMTWKRFPHHWPFERWIHQSPVDSPDKRPVIWSFVVSFTDGLNNPLNKQSSCWKFKTRWCWRKKWMEVGIVSLFSLQVLLPDQHMICNTRQLRCLQQPVESCFLWNSLNDGSRTLHPNNWLTDRVLNCFHTKRPYRTTTH